MSQKTLPPPDQVARWDVRDVNDWLRHNDMTEFINPFNNNGVDGSRLLELDETTIKSFSGLLPTGKINKIVKLLDKSKKAKAKRSGIFGFGKSNAPKVPTRDYYKKCSNAQREEVEEPWDDDFTDEEDDDLTYDLPPEGPEVPSRLPPQNHSQFQYTTHDQSDEDESEELYIEPIDDQNNPPEPPYRHPVKLIQVPKRQLVADEPEDEYLAPGSIQEDATTKPPARPPKTHKDFIGKQASPVPQMIIPAPSISSSDVPPRVPARRSVSPSRNPPATPRRGSSPLRMPAPAPEIPEDFEEETYEVPREGEDCDETYDLPTTEVPRMPTGLKLSARLPMLPVPLSPKHNNSNSNDIPSVPPPIIRYPKTDISKPELPVPRHQKSNLPKPPKDLPKTEETSRGSSAVAKMKQAFEQKSPTLPRKDICNGNSHQDNKSFLHKRLPQPPLPGKPEFTPKESRSVAQPKLPEKPQVSSKPPPTLPHPIIPSSLSIGSRPSPAKRNGPSPVQRNVPNIPSPSHPSPPPISWSPPTVSPTKPVSSNHSNTSPANSMFGYPWYHADLSRERAQRSLEGCAKDGAYIVRDSKRGGVKNPYTVSLLYNKQVRNLQMRVTSDGKYALGSMKEGEQIFDSPLELVEFHQNNALILANSEGKTKLKHPCPVFNN